MYPTFLNSVISKFIFLYYRERCARNHRRLTKSKYGGMLDMRISTSVNCYASMSYTQTNRT